MSLNTSTCGVLAVYAHSYIYYTGMLASTSTGVVTDDTWKCKLYQSDWHLPGFDDSAWPQARMMGANDGSYAAAVTAISSQAKWIWHGTSYEHAYCRKSLC